MKKSTLNLQIAEVKAYLLNLQTSICKALTEEDGQAKFSEDTWFQKSLGYGITRILDGGAVIEKGGVNFSHVFGTKLPTSATEKRPDLAGHSFQALGVSLVIHPQNPYIPTSHANVRLFVATNPYTDPVWWFGGGFDLTPCYGFIEDCIHWHQTAKTACDPFGEDVYSRYKKQCDEYFYIKHRNEPRGIGGLFFDDLNEWGFEKCFAFMKSIGDHYIKAYRPIVAKRKNMSFGLRERQFQIYRRGRYAEFNLIYDRGTLFGLQTSARPEAVLMSLPPLTGWQYDWQPQPNTEEERFYRDFLVPKNWLTNTEVNHHV